MDLTNDYGCKAIQEALLPLMKDFHSFCKDNDIKYVVAWGTALGAVRHNGFIPWDDDLDVDMRRSDFHKLKECIKKSNVLELIDDPIIVGWIPRIRYKNSVQITGYNPTLDVFFIDNIPDSSFLRKLHLATVLMVQNTLRPGLVVKGTFLEKTVSIISHILGLPFPLSFKYRVFDKICGCNNGKQSKNTGSFNVEYIDVKKTYDGDVLDYVVEKSFEDTVVYLPKNTHQFLVDQFGENYMIPPTDKKPKHIS